MEDKDFKLELKNVTLPSDLEDAIKDIALEFSEKNNDTIEKATLGIYPGDPSGEYIQFKVDFKNSSFVVIVVTSEGGFNIIDDGLVVSSIMKNFSKKYLQMVLKRYKKMNEAKFKKYISEIAAKIADVDFLLLEEDPKDVVDDEEEDMYKDTTKQDRSEKGVMDVNTVIYNGIKHGTPTEKAVMDKNLTKLAQEIEDQSGRDVTKIMFGKKTKGQSTDDKGIATSGGFIATEFKVVFRKGKPFSASILPNDRIVYDSRSNFITPELKKQVDSFLSTYKSRLGTNAYGVRYQDIKLSDAMKKRATDVLSKLILDIDDTVEDAVISQKRVGGRNDSVTFKVVFDNMPTFLELSETILLISQNSLLIQIKEKGQRLFRLIQTD